MKKFISAAVAAAMLAGLLPMTGMASTVSASSLDTTANRNLVSGGASLLDDTYQYSAYGDSYYAYLWVPESAAYLNGVMIAKSNLIEAQLMQSKTVRDTLAKYNIGVVYLHERNTVEHDSATSYMGDFDYTETGNTGAELDELMAKLAAASGYDELRWTPFIGVGHSAGMGLGRAIASWDPSRVIAQVCLKGGTNLSNPGHKDSGNKYDIQPGVPTYIDAGQFTEHAGYDNPAGKDNYIDNDIATIKQLRANGTDRLVTMSIEWESGHYDWTETSNGMLAAYLDTIIPLRLGGPDVQLTEDYSLTDLTNTGYVSDIKMFGTRTSEYSESEYTHGAVSEISETDQKSMVWFPTEELYSTIRSYTADRKDIPSDDDDDTVVSYVSYDRSYNNSTGAFSLWPATNICFYVRDDQSIVMEFDISELKNAAGVEFTAPLKSGNQWRNITISAVSSPWDSNRSFTVPSGGTVIAENINSANVKDIDVTSAVQAATGDKLYLVMSSTDSGSGSDYYATTEYSGYTNGSLTTDKANLPRLTAVDDPNATEAPVKTKHQYLQLEDPSSKTPKTFTRITRYDMVNPNNSSYADGLSGDPMTFSMYVDKMNVVSPDHIGAGSKVRATSDTPAVLTPVMAPVEWVGAVQETLTSDDIANNVASKWRNVLRWKNNRVYYRAIFQDSYINLNTFDVYDGDKLKFAYATNTYQISPPYITGGTEQHIAIGDIADIDKGFGSFTISPLSSAGLTVDTMVEYGPVKATLNSDGTYTITPDQIPAGAQFPIECKLVFTQFGVNNGSTKINTAAPVEKVFYITDGSDISVPANGRINAAALKAAGVTGFNVEGSGTITLGMNTDTKFTASRAAAISAERANSADTEYQKHYQYPSGYDPHDHWNLYPAEWTASGSGFIPLSQFANSDGEMLNLDFINTISTSGITAITPVTAQTEVYGLTAASYGTGAKLSWAEPIGNAFDSVKVYVDGEEKAVLLSGDTYAVVTGLEDGSRTFKVTTVKGGNESAGAETEAVIDATKYLVEDFETGSLNRVLSGQVNQPVYNAMSQTGAALSLITSGSTYLGMQNNYTSTVQTVDIEIPGGIAKEMTALTVDIKVDKLEDTYSSGQVYFELYDPTTGKSYGIEKGSDFALDDKAWHEGYSIPLSSFNLPSSESALAQITVLKIGRKVVGGGNNNRRGKIYLDNIGFAAEEPIPTKKLTLSYDNVVGKDGTLPNGFTTTEENVNCLFDGDTTSANLYTSSKQKRLYIDLGKEYKISKIVVYDYTSNGTLCVGGGTTDPATLSGHDAGFKTMLRTNGSTQNGVASSYEEITGGRVATANDIYTASAFESVRYISFFDWSNDVSAAELEIYVVDEDEPVVIDPTAMLAQIYTSEGKENVTGEATAWSLTVTPGTYSGKLVLGVAGAETIKQSDTVLTAGQGGVVFGILVNKVVTSDVFSATLGNAAVTIE